MDKDNILPYILLILLPFIALFWSFINYKIAEFVCFIYDKITDYLSEKSYRRFIKKREIFKTKECE